MIRNPYAVHAHGKLLLTGEYFVLDGATALALPTQLGQHLKVSSSDGPAGSIEWQSLDDEGEAWFNGVFHFDSETGAYEIGQTDGDETARRIKQLLDAAAGMNAELAGAGGLRVKTRLEFPLNWGLGSSSTLVHNVAEWLGIDAFELLAQTFGGSGYDVACAATGRPIYFQLRDGRPDIRTADFRWAFTDHLYFVHLEQKQDSREAIRHYRSIPKADLAGAIHRIDHLTERLAAAADLHQFMAVIDEHEAFVSYTLSMPKVRDRLFPDFNGSIKSLGAWGGDFALAASAEPWHNVVAYFTDKGFPTVVSWKNLILE